MKIGVIADVHGNSPALRSVLDLLLERVERVLFLGDMAGYYPFVNECMDLWDEGKIIAVMGNHDRLLAECIETGLAPPTSYSCRYGTALERSWRSLSPKAVKVILSWPQERWLHLAAKTLYMCHGAPWNLLEARIYPDFDDWERFEQCPADIILLGHTHYPLIKRWKNKLILNPGSVGQPRDRVKGASFAELDLSTGQVQHYRVVYDAASVVEDVRSHDPQLPYLAEVFVR